MHHKFYVSSKAAIFNSDLTKVLAIYISERNCYGLPGGHIEKDESPDQAMYRELYEECGIRPSNLKHVDFFVHDCGKIVLGYTGTINDSNVEPKQIDIEGIPKWLSKSEYKKVSIDEGYRKFVLENWPNK